jgi:uncharacterized protein (TIGR02996 family)
MTDDAAFILALAAAPDDMALSLIYADWLEESGDTRAAVLRGWSELSAVPYSEGNVERLNALGIGYRELVSQTDPTWLAQVGRARKWVNEGFAEKLVRVYLRTQHGFKEDRQRLQFGHWPTSDEWHVRYWRYPPSGKRTSWWGARSVWVHVLSGRVRPGQHR